MCIYTTSVFVFIQLVYTYLYNQCTCIYTTSVRVYTTSVHVFIQLVYVYLYN